MGTETGYQVRCKGNCGGMFRPLRQQGNRDGAGRYYYNHPYQAKPGEVSCKYEGRFNPDIDDVETLIALHPEYEFKRTDSLKASAPPTRPKSLKASEAEKRPESHKASEAPPAPPPPRPAPLKKPEPTPPTEPEKKNERRFPWSL